jgi:hypothetical protein
VAFTLLLAFVQQEFGCCIIALRYCFGIKYGSTSPYSILEFKDTQMT